MFDGLKTELILEKPIFNSIWTNFDLFLRQVYLMKSIRAFAKNQKFFFSCFSHYIKLLCKIVILGKKKLN